MEKEKKEIIIYPSDLSYLWNDSKLGFYDKYVLGIWRPYGPFPSVFKTMDEAMKKSFDKQNILDIVENAPSGILVHDEINVKSKFIDLGEKYKISFKGKIDSLLLHDDGTYSIIDYKTSMISEQLKETYFLQLMTYAYCLENPETGTPKKVSSLGLIGFQPIDFHYEVGEGAIRGEMQYISIPFDKDKFKKWLLNDLCPLLYKERDDVEQSSNDKLWEKYINSFCTE